MIIMEIYMLYEDKVYVKLKKYEIRFNVIRGMN